MRINKIFVALSATLPAVSSVSIPPPDDLCRPGSQRCFENNLEACGSHGNYVLVQACSDSQFCTIDVNHPEVPGHCSDHEAEPEACPRSANYATAGASCIVRKDDVPDGSPPQGLDSRSWMSQGTPDAHPVCDNGESRCLGDARQTCEDNVWKSTMCPKPSKCVKHDDTVQCWVKPSPPSTVPEPCTPGDRKCDSNTYALKLCGEDGIYRTERKCATYGDCITDSPGKAHCQTGSAVPQKFKRQEDPPQCTHGDWACDTHRRFMYECAKNGTWLEPTQCSRAGACQPEEPTTSFPKGRAVCAGFPQYLYPDDRVCETIKSCEFMLYMYCSAGSDDPETKEKCRTSMCLDKACPDCDRCTYNLGYGEVLEPDLRTIIHGSPATDSWPIDD